MAPDLPPKNALDHPRQKRKQQKGFSVGPANLPDGTYRRKVQKIKKSLIHKAKLKKEYAKIKARHEKEEGGTSKHSDQRRNQPGRRQPAVEASLDPHPERVKMMEDASRESDTENPVNPRSRRARMQPFQKETELARKRKADAEIRQRIQEAHDEQRLRKIAEREKSRKIMARARAGPGHQRKLGRESTVLLTKVQNLIDSR